MAKKIGNGGHGQESYDPKTGQYIDSGNVSVADLEELGLDLDLSGDEFDFLNEEEDFLDIAQEVEEYYNSDEMKEIAYHQENLDDYTAEEKIEALKKSPYGYDKDKIENLSEEELNELAYADSMLNKLDDVLFEKNYNYSTKGWYNIWKDKIVTVKDYDSLKDSIELKKDYYNKTGNVSKLNELLEFEEAGKKYSEASNAYEAILVNKNKYENIQAKYLDKNYAYGKYRKDQAVWNKNYQETLKKYGDEWDLKKWPKISSEGRSALIEYTGSYNKFNEPLRSKPYIGDKSLAHLGGFSKAINAMTEAIDQCTWSDDIWVQRGVDASNCPIFSVDGKNKVNISSLDKIDLKNLVGTRFKEDGFYSSAGSKGSGFAHKNLIINTYCPKGTKMAYMNTKGHYSDGVEDEFILQRGYSYRITKVEKRAGKMYLDCEVLLGSDENKPVGAELKQIGEKYFK